MIFWQKKRMRKTKKSNGVTEWVEARKKDPEKGQETCFGEY